MKEAGVFALVAVALLVCSYLAVLQGNEQALIAVVSILTGGAGYYFRGKVEESK